MSLSIVVPFYNEEDCLKECFFQITETFKNSDYELIFVNDGSTDNSHEIILSLIKNEPNIKYVFYNKNKGYSLAVIEGFKKAEKDFVSFIDADLQYSPKDLFKMYQHAVKNNYDFVVGVPEKNKKYKSPIRAILSFCYNTYNSLLFGVNLKDHNYLKLMKRKYLEKINFISGYGIMVEVETLLGFKMQGIAINTYPINVQKRLAGKSKCFSTKTILYTTLNCAKLKFLKNKLVKNA